ncbi:MAG: glycosyltransferase family 4 protein [Chloroflexi bacterium]|nr:glycosyltransferase family 4 protein [Chloroflexota bacterium]
MKILHVVQGYTPAIGGTERVIQIISERLVKQYDDEVLVFTTNAAKNCEVFWLQNQPTLPVGIETINGVTVRRFPIFNRFGHVRHQITKFADWANLPFKDWFRAFFNGPIVFSMTREITRFKADVICASSFPFLHMYAALAGGKRSGRPVVLVGALHPTDAWSFDRPMIYKAIRQADAYIAYSQFERDYLIQQRDIPASLIHTIGAGVDPDLFATANGQELRDAYGWGDDPVVAYVGQLNRRKGAQHLLAAMPHVWNLYPQAKLLLAGASSTYSGQLEQEAARLAANVPNRVVMIKDFSEEEKAKIFAACDVLVFPSSEESFGLVFVEAWACGKPVIGARAGAIPSIISDGVDGLLVTPGQGDELVEAICQLLANPIQRARLGEAGYTKMRQNYTWDIVTDKFRKVYSQVVTSDGSVENEISPAKELI